MTTLAQARSAIRARLDEASAIQWSDAYLNMWINEAVKDLARRTETLMVTTDVNSTAGLNTVSAPTNVLRLYRVEYLTHGDVKPLQYYDINNMDAIWWQSQESTTGEPWAYTTKSYPPTLKVQLYPTPTDAGVVRIHYYSTPATAAVADTDVLPIATGWEDLAYDYTEMRALRTDGDSRWQTAFQIYESNCARMIEQSRRWVEHAGGIVETGGGMLPAWLVDLGY